MYNADLGHPATWKFRQFPVNSIHVAHHHKITLASQEIRMTWMNEAMSFKLKRPRKMSGISWVAYQSLSPPAQSSCFYPVSIVKSEHCSPPVPFLASNELGSSWMYSQWSQAIVSNIPPELNFVLLLDNPLSGASLMLPFSKPPFSVAPEVTLRLAQVQFPR
jgi:hypothetical protein